MKTRRSCFAVCALLGVISPILLAAQTTTVSSATAEVSVPAAKLAPAFSGGLNELVKLAHSGVDESVILAFIHNSPVAYNPSVDEILKLRDTGISSPVLTAILQHGGELRAKAAPAQPQYAAAPTPMAPQPETAANYSTPEPAAPAASVVYTIPYPTYNYITPSYGYGYGYYYPSYYYSSIYYPYYGCGYDGSRSCYRGWSQGCSKPPCSSSVHFNGNVSSGRFTGGPAHSMPATGGVAVRGVSGARFNGGQVASMRSGGFSGRALH